MNFDQLQADPILTLAETAAYLRVHRSTVTRLALAGQLKSYVIGNRRLFKLSEVQVFFDNRECVKGA